MEYHPPLQRDRHNRMEWAGKILMKNQKYIVHDLFLSSPPEAEILVLEIYRYRVIGEATNFQDLQDLAKRENHLK